MNEDEENRLTQLYFYQFTNGCDQVVCNNEHCARCTRFILANSLSNHDKLLNYARNCARNHYNESKLCEFIPPHATDKLYKEKRKNFFNFVSQFINDSKISTRDLVVNFREVFSDIPTFSDILMTSEFPLNLINSNIDDDLLFEFSTKVSSIQHITAALLDCVNSIAKNLITDMNDNKNHFANCYSRLRALLLIFYFPAVITPQCTATVLDPLLALFTKLSTNSSRVVISWISQLGHLRRQMIGACHFSISMYFATTVHPDVHSERMKGLIDAMAVFHEANSFSEKPLPPLMFYNHHIDEIINLHEELELRKDRADRFASLLVRPFILSLKTKAAVCQLESQHLMSMMAFRTFLLDAINSRNTTDIFLTLHIRRSHLMEDAVNQLSIQNAYSFLKKLKVVFEGESAVDVGGPSREFLYLISESLFSPDYGMFVIVNDKFNWFSQYSFENNSSFFLVGAIVGLALYNSIVLPIRFPLVVYKRLLTPDKQLTVVDLIQIDPELARSLKQIHEMAERGEDVSTLCLSFSTTINQFDRRVTIPLLEGIGADEVEVNNENVELYIDAYVKFVLVNSVKEHYEYFKQGFDFTCRVPSYKLLEPEEIDILVSGEEVLDWGALQRCASYSGGYTSKSRAVKWFWELFQKFSNDDKLKFLKFATGTDRAPVGGLGKLKLVIQRGADPNRMPISHTCFNTFTLPDYRSKRVLEERVTMAIQQNEGFGIV